MKKPYILKALLLSLTLASASSLLADESEAPQNLPAHEWHQRVAGVQAALNAYKAVADDLGTRVVSQDSESRDHKLYLATIQFVTDSLAALSAELEVLNVATVDAVWNDAQAAYQATQSTLEAAVEEYALLEGRYNALAPKSPGDGTWESVESAFSAVSNAITTLQAKLAVLSQNQSQEASAQALAANVQAHQDLLAQLTSLAQHPTVVEDPSTSASMNRSQVLFVGGVGVIAGVIAGYILASR